MEEPSTQLHPVYKYFPSYGRYCTVHLGWDGSGTTTGTEVYWIYSYSRLVLSQLGRTGLSLLGKGPGGTYQGWLVRPTLWGRQSGRTGIKSICFGTNLYLLRRPKHLS